jgi:hypothetical protein
MAANGESLAGLIPLADDAEEPARRRPELAGIIT